MNDFRNFDCNGIRLYKSEFKEEWLSYIHNPSIILEFGSYDGGDGAFYKQKFPEARVLSIEASPDRFNIIKSYSDKIGVEVYNFAVSNKDGFANFYEVFDPNVLDSDSKTGSSGSLNQRTEIYKKNFPHLSEKAPIPVETIRLDSFCNKNSINFIDFIHVDVEGGEHLVLEGLGDLRPKVMLLERYLGKEYYGDSAYNVGDIERICDKMGYIILESTPSDILVGLK